MCPTRCPRAPQGDQPRIAHLSNMLPVLASSPFLFPLFSIGTSCCHPPPELLVLTSIVSEPASGELNPGTQGDQLSLLCPSREKTLKPREGQGANQERQEVMFYCHRIPSTWCSTIHKMWGGYSQSILSTERMNPHALWHQLGA